MRVTPRSVLRAARRSLRRTGATPPAGPVATRRADVRRSLADAPPPRPQPRDGQVRAWIVTGPWLGAALPWQWAATAPQAGQWRSEPDPSLLLVEVVDGQVLGWPTGPSELAELAELAGTLAGRGVPVIVWDTGRGGDVGPEQVTRHASAIAVSDPGRVARWQQLVPGAQVEALGPVVEPRIAAPGGPAVRRLAAGLLPVRADRPGAGPDPELGEVAARSTTDVWLIADAPAGPRAARTIRGGRLGDLLGRYRVCLTDDPWVAVAAGAAQTPVVWQGTPPPEIADAVTIADGEETRRAIAGRINQGELRDREGLLLHRAVLGGMTLERRASSILRAAGLPVPPRRTPSVSAVVPTNRAHEIDNVLDNLGRQRHDRLQLVLVLHGLDVPDADLKARAAERGVRDLTVLRADPGLTLGSCMNLGVQAAEGDYVAKMDDDNYYGEFFLTDLLTAFDHTDAGIVGKWAHYVWLRSSGAVVLRYPKAEHTYERRIQGGSMLFDGAVVRELGFSDIPRAVDSDILDRAIAAGVRIYSGDRFNYVSVRGTDRTGHTWPVEDATFLTGAGSLVFYGDPRPHVSV